MYRLIKHPFILLICIKLLFASCQKDDSTNTYPEDLKIKFDTTTYITDLGRDSANFAHLQLSISLPDKIDRIEIYSSNDTQAQDILEDFRGMCRLEFDYPIDISDFLQDTNLIYTLKVYDMKAHCYNKRFIFNIKPYSTPQIILPDGKKLFTDLSSYKIRARFTTGSIPMAQIRFSIDGKEQKVSLPEGQVTEFTLNQSVSLNYLKEYAVTLQVKDINGRQYTSHLTVTKISKMEKPVKIICEGKERYEFRLDYDIDTDELIGIDLVDHYKFSFTYGHYETANLITQISQTGYNGQEDTIVYFYEYDSQKRLKNIMEKHNGKSEILIDQCHYDIQQFTGYTIGNRTIGNIAFENLGTLGKPISEIWNARFPDIQDHNRTKASDYWTVKIPTFIKAIPNSMFVAFQVNIPFQDLFLSQYIHLKNVSYLDNSVITDNYDYETDEQGRLSKITREIIDREGHQTSRYVYRYLYQDSVISE